SSLCSSRWRSGCSRWRGEEAWQGRAGAPSGTAVAVTLAVLKRSGMDPRGWPEDDEWLTLGLNLDRLCFPSPCSWNDQVVEGASKPFPSSCHGLTVASRPERLRSPGGDEERRPFGTRPSGYPTRCRLAA